MGRRVILLSREVLIDASQRENAWRTRESGLLPVTKTFEPRTGAQPDRFAALPNPGIHSPIPPEIEPDVLTDIPCLRVAQGGIRQVLACDSYQAHWVFRCMRMVVVRSPVSVLRYDVADVVMSMLALTCMMFVAFCRTVLLAHGLLLCL